MWDTCWRNFCVFSLVTKKNVKSRSKLALFSNEHHFEIWFPKKKKKKTITFFRRKLSKLHHKDTILHVTITFSLKEGQTRSSSSWPIWVPVSLCLASTKLSNSKLCLNNLYISSMFENWWMVKYFKRDAYFWKVVSRCKGLPSILVARITRNLVYFQGSISRTQDLAKDSPWIFTLPAYPRIMLENIIIEVDSTLYKFIFPVRQLSTSWREISGSCVIAASWMCSRVILWMHGWMKYSVNKCCHKLLLILQSCDLKGATNWCLYFQCTDKHCNSLLFFFTFVLSK